MRIAVDASALLAILLDEPDSEVYMAKLLSASKAWISPVNWWEVQVRMRARYGETGASRSAAWIEDIGIVIEPVTAAYAKIAVSAAAQFKGAPARLNLGDCFAYALAKVRGVPLLYKGTDFKHTDLSAA